MRNTFLAMLISVLVGLTSPTNSRAQQSKETPDPTAAPSKLVAKQEIVSSKHEININGKKLAYTATVGYMPLKDDKGKETANIFFIAYTLDGKDTARRPLTFAFNGGPGSSSVWLHMGVLGPKRVKMKESGETLPPPYKMVDNQYTLLTDTDLVFIDPVSTGFSRAAKDKKGKDFHGVRQDIESVGEFIRIYLSKNDRWNSPKFLVGESYGTTRAAGLARHLQSRHGINLNGIVLVSAVLNFQTIRFDEGNDLPYILFLPSYTATAWFHKQLPSELMGDLKKTLQEAERFAETEYNVALFKGNRLTPAETKTMAKKLARFTGLSEKYILRSNLRIKPQRFFRELLRDQRRTVGRFDSRFLGKDGEAAGETPQYDPSYAIIQGPYSSIVNHYIRSELGFKSDLVYEILTGKVQPWDFGRAENRYLNVSGDLSMAITQNPHLKVFIANGYYDLATPFFATEYTVSHLELDESLVPNIRMGYYEAGHMMYIHMPSLQRFREDLASFYESSLPRVEK